MHPKNSESSAIDEAATRPAPARATSPAYTARAPAPAAKAKTPEEAAADASEAAASATHPSAVLGCNAFQCLAAQARSLGTLVRRSQKAWKKASRVWGGTRARVGPVWRVVEREREREKEEVRERSIREREP